MKVIAVFTETGGSARLVSKYRPRGADCRVYAEPGNATANQPAVGSVAANDRSRERRGPADEDCRAPFAGRRTGGPRRCGRNHRRDADRHARDHQFDALASRERIAYRIGYEFFRSGTGAQPFARLPFSHPFDPRSFAEWIVQSRCLPETGKRKSHRIIQGARGAECACVPAAARTARRSRDQQHGKSWRRSGLCGAAIQSAFRDFSS